MSEQAERYDSSYGWMPHHGQEDLYDRLDPGIRETVRILREHGIETNDSCEGTRGHCFPFPQVGFSGTYEAGFRALALCFTYGLPVASLERVWSIDNGEVVGPQWRLTFTHIGGGGLQLVEREDGVFRYEWGEAPRQHTEPPPGPD